MGDDLLALYLRPLVFGGRHAHVDLFLQKECGPVPVILLEDVVQILQRLLGALHRHVDARDVEQTVDVVGHLPDRLLGGDTR